MADHTATAVNNGARDSFSRKGARRTGDTARLAGVLYLVAGLPAAFSMMYVARALTVPGDPAATGQKILGSETLFRAGMAGELISAVALLYVAILLYRLFCKVNATQARLMVTLALVSVPMSFLNVLNDLAAVTLLRGATVLSVFEPQQRSALATLFLGLHHQGLILTQVFWGLWLLPLALLVLQSKSFPRIVAYLLIAACVGYVGSSVVWLLLPTYATVGNQIGLLLEGLGEPVFLAWLLFKGASVERLLNPSP